MKRAVEDTNRRMLRARDAMGRAYAQPLDVPTLARIAHVSEAHFARPFRVTFGETACQVRELVTKGAMGGWLSFATDDCRKTYETLPARGVEFTEEPTERPYGTDCGLRDPFGNRLRFTQPKRG
ncbi:VOC family protein [Streptomyces sp. NRRL F-5755]|uniref:VOC family protein n=1 Tax=Streptomyces sp. NRRL F-5755 TaxID=1519475 RepID=UPI00099CAA0E|nr:VOC family protein [Streptomyces sp. NRRL F-5755]